MLSGMDVSSTVSATEKASRVADIPQGTLSFYALVEGAGFVSTALDSDNAGILSGAPSFKWTESTAA